MLRQPVREGLPPPPPQPAARMRPGAAQPLTVGAVALAGTALLAVVDPATNEVPLCPLRALTGLDCPFCGCLRAVGALVRLDIGAALDHNVLFTAAVPFLVVAWGLWLASTLRPGAPEAPATSGTSAGGWRPPRWAFVGLLVVAGVFGVARNLPSFEWLASTA